jgi:hypothetical protein
MADRDHTHDVERSRSCDRCGVEGCPLAFTGDGYVCEGCWPDTAPDEIAVLDQLATFELRIGELRGIVAGIGEAYLATLPELERRLIIETRAHLAAYDRAKRGEGTEPLPGVCKSCSDVRGPCHCSLCGRTY